MFQHIADLFQNQTGLAHITLKSAFTQILLECIVNLLFIFGNRCIKPAKCGDPCVDRKGSAGLKISSLLCNKLFNFLFRHVLSLLPH